jgi:hypothetical protein
MQSKFKIGDIIKVITERPDCALHQGVITKIRNITDIRNIHSDILTQYALEGDNYRAYYDDDIELYNNGLKRAKNVFKRIKSRRYGQNS